MTVQTIFRFFLIFCLMGLQACQLNKVPDAATYNTQLGMAYLKQGDMPRAKRKLLTALRLAPHSPDVNVAMAYYLEKTGDIHEAQVYYQKALAQAQNSGEQLNNYGTFLCRLGHYTEAEAYFLKAVADVHYIYTAASYENAGLCIAAISKPKAKQYFIKALEHDPKRKQALYELVTIELKQGKANQALAHLQQYASLSFNDPNLLAMAIKAAQLANNKRLAGHYQYRLTHFMNHTGATNDNNKRNG